MLSKKTQTPDLKSTEPQKTASKGLDQIHAILFFFFLQKLHVKWLTEDVTQGFEQL